MLIVPISLSRHCCTMLWVFELSLFIQRSATRYGKKCWAFVTRIDFLCNDVALKIVVKSVRSSP